MLCYVYLWFRPNGIPLYCGWGKHRPDNKRPRWADHIKYTNNKHLKAAFDKYGFDLPIIILRNGLTPEEAKLTEIAFIKAIGRKDNNGGCLANHTDGGDGLINPSQETRDKIRDGNLGRTHKVEPDRGTKISAAKKGKPMSPSHLAAIRKSWETRERAKSPEFKAQVSKTMTGRTFTEEHKQNLRKPHGSRGPMPEEQKAKIAEALKNHTKSPETLAKLSASAKAAWANPEIRERQTAAIRAATPKISETMKRVRARKPKE